MLRRVGRRTKQWALALAGCFAVLMLFVSTASISAAPGLANGRDLRQQLAVPAYMDPIADAGGWSQLTGARPGTVGIVVANVENGPDDRRVPAWASAIGQARATGAKVLGYVDTGYLGSPITGHPDGLLTRAGLSGLAAWIPQIEADVNAWYRFYGSDIDGIFFDEGTNQCGPSPSSNLYADEYQFLTQYVKESHPGAVTALNPGTAVPQCYQDAADVLVTFEGSYGDYTGKPESAAQAYQPLNWSPVDPDKIWHIVYGTPTQSEMESVIALSKSRNAGYIYVTNDVPANPYDTIPSLYWADEQNQMSPSGNFGSTPPTAPSDVTASDRPAPSAGGGPAGGSPGPGSGGDLFSSGALDGSEGNGGSGNGTVGVDGGLGSNSADVQLSWQPSSKGSAPVVAYDVYQGRTWLGSVGGDSDTLTVAGLRPSSTYTFSVRARDSSGAVSDPGPPATATTTAPSGSAPPGAPSSLTATATSFTTAQLQWDPPGSADQSVSSYVVRQNGVPIITVPASITTVGVQGLQPGLATYTFSVTAVDSAGSPSAPSPYVDVTTAPLPDDQPVSSPAVVDNGNGTLTYSAQFATPFAFRRVFISTGASPCWTTANATPICGNYLLENDQLLKYVGSGTDFTYRLVDMLPPTVTGNDRYSWTIPAADIGDPAGQVTLFNGEGYAPISYTGLVSEGSAPSVGNGHYRPDQAGGLGRYVQSVVRQGAAGPWRGPGTGGPAAGGPRCPSAPDDTWHLGPTGGCMVGALSVADSLVDGLLPGAFTIEVTDTVDISPGTRAWREKVTLEMEAQSGTVPDYSVTVAPTCSDRCTAVSPATATLVAGVPVTMSFGWRDPGAATDIVNVASAATLTPQLPALTLPFKPTSDPPTRLGWSTPALLCQASGCVFPESAS
jgi:Spherulation-specific family 4/Fibronectin type III domain